MASLDDESAVSIVFDEASTQVDAINNLNDPDSWGTTWGTAGLAAVASFPTSTFVERFKAVEL